MAQAPDLTPDVAPTTAGVAGPQLAVPVDAFGGAVGHALQGLGNAVEQGSDRIWQRAVEMQNINNETEAKDADAQYMMKAGSLHADFSSLEGNAAKAAFPKYMQDLQDLRKSIREGMSNPAAQRMYDSSSLSVMGRTIFNGAGHAAQQSKVAASNASQARVDSMSDGIGSNPTDELTYQRYTRGIAAETSSQGDLHGWSPDQTNETVKQNISTAVAKRIVGLARTDAIGAQAMFDRATKSGDLLPTMADRVQATVETQFRQQGSRIISDKVLSSRRQGDEGPEKTEDQYISDGMAEAQRIAKQTGIKDPLFPDFVRERISADYRRQRGIERDNEQASEQTVAAAMLQGNKEGVLPKSVDELRLVDPKVSDAWDNLRPTTQKKYMHEMALNALGNRVSWNDENLRTYQQMKGQAHDDPVSFLARDVISEKLPSSAKRELINLQQRLRSQSESDPRVARALSILTPDLRAAGIDRSSKEDYYQFVGSLQDQLDQFQKDHKKVPSLEEVRTIGAQLMQEQATGRRGWLVFTHESTPAYQLPVPPEEAERLRRDPYWADRNTKPNDEMIARIYRAQKFKELYGGAAKKPAQAQFPPNEPNP